MKGKEVRKKAVKGTLKVILIMLVAICGTVSIYAIPIMVVLEEPPLVIAIVTAIALGLCLFLASKI